jgi:hypothetical protein
MITDLRARSAQADEVLADVRDLDEVRVPDEDARARAPNSACLTCAASGTSIPTRLILGGRCDPHR